jgi:hypothetical protein
MRQMLRFSTRLTVAGVFALFVSLSLATPLEASFLQACKRLFSSINLSKPVPPEQTTELPAGDETSPADNLSREDRMKAIATDRSRPASERRSAYLQLSGLTLEAGDDRRALLLLGEAQKAGDSDSSFWEEAGDLFRRNASFSNPNLPFRIRKAISAYENARDFHEPGSQEWKRLNQKMIEAENQDGYRLFFEDYLRGVPVLSTALVSAQTAGRGEAVRQEVSRMNLANEIDGLWVAVNVIGNMTSDQILQSVRKYLPEVDLATAEALIYSPVRRNFERLEGAVIDAASLNSSGRLSLHDSQSLIHSYTRLLEVAAMLPSTPTVQSRQSSGEFGDTDSVPLSYREFVRVSLEELPSFAEAVVVQKDVLAWLDRTSAETDFEGASWAQLLIYSEIYSQAAGSWVGDSLIASTYAKRSADLQDRFRAVLQQTASEDFSLSPAQVAEFLRVPRRP